MELDTASSDRRRLIVVAAAIFWPFLGFAQGTLMVRSMAGEGLDIPLEPYILWQTLVLGSWALLTPPIVWFAWRWPIASRSARNLLLNTLPALVIVLVHLLVTAAVTHWVAPMEWAARESILDGFLMNLRTRFVVDSIVVAGIIAIVNWIRESDRSRRRELVNARLEASLAQAELRALQLQIQPHFLFNTLHSISGLIREHRDTEAIDAIAALSDLLRHVLDNEAGQEITLEDELDLVDRYLEIQQARFGERLRVGRQCDSSADRAMVPSLILQPIVENAVSHGIAKRPEGGLLEIGIERIGASLRMTVSNEGPPFEPGVRRVGLANTASRLAMLHGDAASLDIENVAGRVVVTITLPFRESVT